jgi:hypothetical protein
VKKSNSDFQNQFYTTKSNVDTEGLSDLTEAEAFERRSHRMQETVGFARALRRYPFYSTKTWGLDT